MCDKSPSPKQLIEGQVYLGFPVRRGRSPSPLWQRAWQQSGRHDSGGPAGSLYPDIETGSRQLTGDAEIVLKPK